MSATFCKGAPRCHVHERLTCFMKLGVLSRKDSRYQCRPVLAPRSIQRPLVRGLYGWVHGKSLVRAKVDKSVAAQLFE